MRFFHPLSRLPRSHRSVRAIMVVALAGIVLAAPAPAQETGAVTGQVVDASGEALPGVDVIARSGETTIGVVTDRTGRYRIRSVPVGRATIETSFLGYRPGEATVVVPDDGTVVRNFQLEIAPVEVAGIRAETQRDVLRTLERKRQAIEIVDVLDLETLQELPLQDIIEGLDQLPAVNIQGVSAGRGFRNSFVVVRGIQPNLNRVSVMGFPLVSTTGDRAVALDVLPGSMASQLEVVKAITPDMDANTIGGTVNIVPLSAFDRRRPFFLGSIEGAGVSEVGTFEGDDTPLNLNLAAGRRLGETFGITGFFNFKQEEFSRIFSQPDDWEPIPQPGFPEDLFVPEGTRLEQSRSSFERVSGTAMLDWRPELKHSIRWLASFTETEDEQISTQTEWNFADGKDNIDFELISPTQIFTPEGENEKEMDIDVQEEQLFFTVADAEFDLQPLTWKLGAGYVRGEIDELVREWSFGSENFAGTIDLGREIPWAFPESQAFFDPSNFTFDEIDIEPQRIESESFQASTDLRIDTRNLGESGFLKFGGFFRTNDTFSDRDENQMEFNEASGFADITLEGLGLDGDADPVRGLPIGPVIDPFAGPRFIEQNPDFLFFNEGASIDDQIEGDYEVSEDVAGGYGMVSIDAGALSLVGGLRIEYTETESTVQAFNEQDETFSTEIVTKDFTDVLPNVHVRYRFNDRVQLRGAATRTLARARLSDLAGSRNIDFDNSDVVSPGVVSDADVESGNPDLDPFESINLDATLEFFPRRGSFYMVGVFYKDIDNAIFIQEIEERDVTLGGTLFQRLTFEQPLNAESGEILGLEAQVQETFTFLPGALSGLGVSANVALLDSEFTVPGREGEDLPFFQQPDVILNVTPFFRYGGFNARLSFQYTDDFVTSFGSDPDDDEFVDSRETVDLQVGYTFQDRYTVLFAVENATNAEIREFQGDESRTSALEELGEVFWVGFRVR